MAFDRITQDEISQNGVVSAPDKLTGTAADNKAIFDKLIKNIVAREFNKLLDDLEAATGAASIGAAPFDGVEGKNIQDQLKNVQSNVSTSFDGTTINGHKIPGTVVITKGDVGLGNVDNTSDMEKPVSSPQRSYVESVARDFILGQLPVPLPITQGGTNADTPQAALANLGAWARPTLLRNGIFVGGGSQKGSGFLPINQRGKTSYTDGYSIDGWKVTGGGTLTVKDDCIELEATSGSLATLECAVEAPSKYSGKTLTFSALAERVSGTEYCYISNIFDEYKKDAAILDKKGICSLTDTAGSLSTALKFVFVCGKGCKIRLYAAKMEEGSFHTLGYVDSSGSAILLEYPDYGEELFKCQRYYYDSGAFDVGESGNIKTQVWTVGSSSMHYADGVRFPVTMRTTPAVTFYSGRSRTPNKVAYGSSGLDANAVPSAGFAGRCGFSQINLTGEDAQLTGDQISYFYIANAEL